MSEHALLSRKVKDQLDVVQSSRAYRRIFAVLDLGCGIGFHGDLALGQHRIALQLAEAGAAA
jgi:hypothetical protein